MDHLSSEHYLIFPEPRYVKKKRSMTKQQYYVLASIIGINKVAKYYMVFSLREQNKMPFREIAHRMGKDLKSVHTIYKKVILFLDTWESSNDQYSL